MNIRNTVRTIALAGVAASVPLIANATDISAGGALTYSSTLGSDLTAGAVSSSAYASSAATVASEGTAGESAFLTEVITDSTGAKFVRTVILESSGEGLMQMENFVQMGVTGGSGIRGEQLQSASGGFSLNTNLDTGDFNQAQGDGVRIDQKIQPTSGDLTRSNFYFHENATDMGGSGTLIGREFVIDQQINAGTEGTQDFVMLRKGGNFAPSSFTMDVAGVTFSDGNFTNDISVTWIGTNLGATFGLEDIHVDVNGTNYGTGNDSMASVGFTGTTPDTANGFGFDSGLGVNGVQPSF